MTTDRNSLNNWLGNGALTPLQIEEVRGLHLRADPQAMSAQRFVRVGADLLMDWRHAVIVGRFPAAVRDGS